jgi:NADH:ubiquinone oxidoreductase subunit 3 (subunit A)
MARAEALVAGLFLLAGGGSRRREAVQPAACRDMDRAACRWILGRGPMAADYAYVGFFLVVGVLFVILNIEVLSRLIRPRRPNPQKLSSYECGEEPIGMGWVRFHVRYYLYALVYIIFAVETVFLFPWAVVFRQMGMVAFVEMMVFIAILLIGLAYAWKKKALEWV